MSYIPCKFKDKCTRKDCHYSHEPLPRLTGINPTLCKYGDECRRKNCTFIHIKPPERATTTRSDCNNDVNYSRVDCFFNDSNGRFIDRNTSSSPDCTQQNIISSSVLSPFSRSESRTHQRHDSSQSDTSSCNHSRTSSTRINTRIRNCRLGTKCKRTDCYFEHPHGRDIDRVSPIFNNTRTNIKINPENQQLSNSELIEMIDQLLSKAEEQQQEFDINDKDYNDSDDERVLDVLQEHALQELRAQKSEFQSAINCLTTELNSILLSTIGDRYDVVRLQRIQKQLERELKHWQSRLPIYAKRSDIIEKLRRNQILILKADTGSGKSTQIVQYLCDEHFADQKQIICTQPRKLAVRSLSARVAEEYGCRVGEEIGFQVGGGRPMTSHKTKVKFVTDTLFLNEYQNDRMLQKYSIVIVDEAHERKIDTDIAFGIMKQCLKKRKDLKLIVMSATLDMHLLYKYFAHDFQCDTLEIGGRMYPIEDTYLDDDVENYVQASVTKAIEIHQSDEIGDILVFLTGQDEIDLALSDLNQKLDKDESYIGLPLHGKLSEEENARIFEKMPNRRKIIFSTNVAETSVTIDGIKHVIESGMVKEKMWDEKRKMQVLKIGEVTKSSVKQRRGRAGRTSAGKCYHLYTIETYEAMDACSRAEILCTQPTIAILKLKHLNINNIESFEWLESPSESNLREAHQTLIWLNALDSQGKLTDLGRNMARLDIDPKLTVMLYKGKELNCLSYALILAGMLTVSQNIWWTSKDQKSKDMATQTRAQLSHESGDHITFINVYLKWNKFCAKNKNKKQQYEWCKTHSLSGKALQMAHDFIREKARQMEHEIELSDTEEEEELNNDLITRLLLCVTAGHFLNLAISNGPLRAGYQVISGFSPMTTEPLIARVFRTSTLCLNDQMPKYILFNELLNINETNYITILSSIDLNWLKSVSQQWYTTINGANLHTISYDSYTIKNVGATLLRAVVGKRNCNLNKCEELTQAIIDVDYQQAKITIWSRQTNLENAKKIVEKMVEIEKQKLLTEAEEIQVAGRTRILMGAGSVSQMILVEDEFIRIIITKLPIKITEERIRDLCEPFGQIRKIDFIRQNQGGSCVSVTYTTIEEARLAFRELNGVIEQGREIIINSSCLKTEVTGGKQNCRLKAIWYLTPSTGNGRITFSDEKNALDACQLFKRLYYQCHYERSTNFPTLKIIYYLGENNGRAFINFETLQQAQNAVLRMNSTPGITLARGRLNRTGSILFQSVPKDFDEEDVRHLFQSCHGLTNVQVLRGRRGQRFQKPDSAEDEIKSIFSQYKSFQPDTITFNSNIINGKLEAHLEFLDIEDLKEAINEIDGTMGLIGCGKVRLFERIQKKKDNAKKKKENEYIIKFQRLDRSCDKYDLIKILKEHQLYDNVKNVTIFRQKLEDKDLTTMGTAASVEQDIGFIHLRSMFLDGKDLFHSVPDCQIASSTPDGTVTALVLFKDPVDVITAIEIYDNQELELLQRTTKLRLIPSISHEIFINAALTKAIPDKIQQAIQRIRDNFKRVYIKAVPSKKTGEAGTMKIFIDGDDIQQITMAKIEFDNLMKGLEYKFEDDIEKTKILFDRVGTTLLQQIQNETGSYIWWNFSNSFVRIYGSDQASANARRRIDQYIRDTLRNKKHTITLDIPPGYVRQVLKMSATYHETVEKKFNVEISTLVAKRQIRITGREVDVTKCEQIIKNEWSTMPVDQGALSKQTTMTAVVECPICCNTANYSLQACGHAYCIDCLRQELSTKFDTTLSNESLKIKCMMPQCDLALLLRDIKTIIDPRNMPKLARASFQAYLKTDEDIVQCMGIDCNQVYRKSKHPQSYACDGCFKMYCVKCEVEYHMGLTCDAYQALLRWRVEEGPTMRNIGDLDLKPCPSCKQVIDRYDGCNAVKCKCGISFCWLCLKTDPIDIHAHYTDEMSDCYNKCFTRR